MASSAAVYFSQEKADIPDRTARQSFFVASLVLLEPFLRAFSIPQAVEFLGGRLGTDADQVVAVQAVVHIDAVAVEMEVRGPGLVYS